MLFSKAIRVSFLAVLALTASMPVAARADSSPQFDVDAFIDSLDAHDIGERTAYTASAPTIGPAATISGLVTTGNVKGQFEFTCSDLGGNGVIDSSDCGDAAYAAAHFNWKWGALEVADASGFPVLVGGFVDVAGSTFFPSDIALNEGFTLIETQSFNGKDPFARLAHFEFNLEGAGVTLQPGFSYIIFAMLTAESITLPNRVPGEGPGFSGIAEESIYQSAAVDSPPFQFHQAFPVFDDGVTPINQLATSRLIPIVPEPATGLTLIIGLTAVFGRRKKEAI